MIPFTEQMLIEYRYLRLRWYSRTQLRDVDDAFTPTMRLDDWRWPTSTVLALVVSLSAGKVQCNRQERDHGSNRRLEVYGQTREVP